MAGTGTWTSGRFRRASEPVRVIAASRHGSAESIATELARCLGDEGVAARPVRADDVDALPPEGVPIVLGSAVYMGRWLKPARELAARLRQEKGSRPLWLFSVGPLGEPARPAEPLAGEALDQLGADRAVEHRTFAGRLDRSRLNRRERLIVNAVRAPEGDYRDWDAVEEWAGSIAAALRPAHRAFRPAEPALVG